MAPGGGGGECQGKEDQEWEGVVDHCVGGSDC